MSNPTRRRRAPEEARREILDAAERVFQHHQPDTVGLKEVAREASVSHALVTHYFGTYAGLVVAVLERRHAVVREQVLSRLNLGGAAGAEDLLGALFDALEDPMYLRLWLWVLASERGTDDAVFPLHDDGMRIVAGAIAERAAAATGRTVASVQPEIERALVVAVAAAYGYAIGRRGLLAALGREPSSAFDASFRSTLAEMVRGHVLRYLTS